MGDSGLDPFNTAFQTSDSGTSFTEASCSEISDTFDSLPISIGTQTGEMRILDIV